jgi:hypothetical protein
LETLKVRQVRKALRAQRVRLVILDRKEFKVRLGRKAKLVTQVLKV